MDALNVSCVHHHSIMGGLEGDRDFVFGELCLQLLSNHSSGIKMRRVYHLGHHS